MTPEQKAVLWWCTSRRSVVPTAVRDVYWRLSFSARNEIQEWLVQNGYMRWSVRYGLWKAIVAGREALHEKAGEPNRVRVMTRRRA